MKQLLLLADPRPLVERLGADFFRNAPTSAGVYLMRDAADVVLYVGKAKSLRKRLASYRVANPERLRRRHLRLLHSVARIELRECADELSALRHEAELLRALRPRFNRAGTWPGAPRFLGWRTSERGIEFLVSDTVLADWAWFPRSLGAGAVHLRAVLTRLLWCALQGGRGFAGMPAGWARGVFGEIAAIPRTGADARRHAEAEAALNDFFAGRPQAFLDWSLACADGAHSPFERASQEADIEAIGEFVARCNRQSAAVKPTGPS
jgi:predicted GIY-YIG superfamily endonuclease